MTYYPGRCAKTNAPAVARRGAVHVRWLPGLQPVVNLGRSRAHYY